MELKISVKTVLLFTALFILGTMILGFYSCSGNTTPVSPQLTEEFADDGTLEQVDGVTTIVNEDGTITIINEDGDTTTVTTPGTTYTTDDGTTIVTYTVTIDEDGNVLIISNPREGANISGELGDIPVDDDVVEIEFGTFVADGDFWTGDVTVINNSPTTLLNPRMAFGGFVVEEFPPESEHYILADFINTLSNPDIYCTLFSTGKYKLTAYPLVFIADEDEDYRITPEDGSATHEVTLLFDPSVTPYFEVDLLYSMIHTSIVPESTHHSIAPHAINITNEGPFEGLTQIKVTLDADPSTWDPHIFGVLECDYGIGIMVLPLTPELFNEFNQPVYTVLLDWDPLGGTSAHLLACFYGDTTAGPAGDTYLDFTVLE